MSQTVAALKKALAAAEARQAKLARVAALRKELKSLVGRKPKDK